MARRLVLPTHPGYASPTYYRDMAQYERAYAARHYRVARNNERMAETLKRLDINGNGQEDHDKWMRYAAQQREWARECAARAKRYENTAVEVQTRHDAILAEIKEKDQDSCPDCGETIDDPRTHCAECAACAGAPHEKWCRTESDEEEGDENESIRPPGGRDFAL